ncbi:ABC transporter C family member 13 isoform X3 [Hevea brasiliensis]|uniref:ABC transporter C family member 13 isoform X3 n=1 Tax=Hevea brasiliensis TaxID=3981 RepID=UPI0025D4E36F|nr:ABC transporter C family member 13 isoform X3 [Hevea brasiliensis]
MEIKSQNVLIIYILLCMLRRFPFQLYKILIGVVNYVSLTMDTVLGFCANVVTVLMISILAITLRNARGSHRMNFREKVVFHFLPALGACLSFVDMVFLLKKELNGDFIVYHEWLFKSSQLILWTTIIISVKWACFHDLFCNWLLCIWWIMKALLEILHLHKTFSSLEVLECLKESSVVLLDIMFGISINIIRIKQSSSKGSSMEDPLLSVDMDIEGSFPGDSGNTWSSWDLMTFKAITSVMKRGIIKQLGFEDLLWLPNDMEPSTCHDRLLSFWRAQQSSSNPFLFKAICYAYGWPYFCIGLLKVLNDCIGFAGPLLLNKLIRFLQQGSAHWTGYVLALSLGLTSILKSFLDTQYSFHLAKLKLKLRSGIMTVIYQKLAFTNWRGTVPFVYTSQICFSFWIGNNHLTGTRIRRTGEILTHIRTLKMYGWEHLFSSWLMDTRSSEVKHLATRKYLDAWCVFFWATTPTLFSLFTFGLFTLMGHQLEAATVFTCVALFNNLISPLNSFPWVINGLIDAFISTRRLSRFLCCSEYRHELEQRAESPSVLKNYQSDIISEDMAVIMHDACCAWSSSDEQQQNLVLNHVTLSVPKGSFIAIIGEVGSGKSSLLSAILGEMWLIHGSVHSNGSLAYVPQVPWILSGTVRDNILFGKSYESKRYSDTLKACALDVDISLMAGGDMAYIEEKGVNLSGGQRTRLALARAIYQGSDVYMLDDVLSAVDAEVARLILHNAILGPLMNQKARVLCTHNVQAISSADMIVVMDKGHVKWVGSSADLSVSSFSAFSPQNDFDILPNVQGRELSKNTSIEGRNIFSLEEEFIHISEEAQEIVEVEQRKEGKVELAVYKNYAAFCGWFITVVICLSAILMQASRNGNDLWLSYWVDATGSSQADYSTSFYLVVLCIFCIVNSSLTLVRAFSFAFGGLHAAVQVHNTLLNKIIDAPVQFFDQTPAGRILNRFSSDLYTIDDSLPFILNSLLAHFVGLLGIAVVLSYVQVVFLLLLLPFWFIYSKLQFFYRSTSRELRRLDSVSRSPIYATFTETLDGSSTIRAFKSEDCFLVKFIELVALYQRTSYSEIIASLWLSLRLQLLGAFIISFVAMMAVVGSRGYLPISFGTPGLVGLALSYATPIVSSLGSFLTSFTETEKEMVSVERALQYMDIPQEELRGSQSLNLDWPFQGLIEFQNVTMRYMPSLPPALNGVTFTILGGTQVGIVGRTGAGKSSVLNALFRLTPICSGCILVDDLNITHVPVRDLRAHFSVVPQSPFLFEGSLRDNLDPLRMSNDLEIWNILEKCHVKEEVEMAGGLDIHVKQSGSSFSVGQRQLLCLARALLKSSKVLCLDECTANVDTQTASVLQNAISTECKGMTVITIAHRISTVMNMDNILVLDHGNVIEQGNPQTLLQDEFSRFSRLAKASTM